MAQHLKSIIKNRLRSVISSYAPHADISASHARGVRYFVPAAAIEYLCGAMNTVKEGRRYKKHIIVRRHSGRRDVLQLYTYHFPKTWSKACVTNREIIKEAQRRAHALEHDHSYASIEWHIRFLKHYFRVFKGGAEPEPGMKRYSRFYQYTYVAIYRDLKAAQQQALASQSVTEDVSFEPIEHTSRPHIHQGLNIHHRSHIDHSLALRVVQPVPFLNVYCLWQRLHPMDVRDRPGGLH